MSGLLGITSTVGIVGLDAAASILLSPTRGYELVDGAHTMIVPNITMEEQHEDEVIVTHHPVQLGTVINDHAYKLNSKVTVRAGWSNASISALISSVAAGGAALTGFLTETGDTGNTLSNLVGATFGESYPQRIYNQLLDLQGRTANSSTDSVAQPPKLLNVYTGKRTYKNMILTHISIVTNAETEYALIVQMTFQELNLVKVKDATLPREQQQNPEDTQSQTNQGTQTKEATPEAPTSILKKTWESWGKPLLEKGVTLFHGATGI